ncbi:hypothetical protein Q3O60_03300 [Alkalimonas collagenimarina]|uniref:Uncharacterized protein n=1 Tax=Alkalimonas collagenimarina TaxID=400390 RepID=A0ABT9GVY3_9GAMM|nr:hypothetical protein [Alkalimonas collagenimarina]MDP4535214.1 hypothetical protein [Alkalimonas collagenimarina]
MNNTTSATIRKCKRNTQITIFSIVAALYFSEFLIFGTIAESKFSPSLGAFALILFLALSIFDCLEKCMNTPLQDDSDKFDQ